MLELRWIERKLDPEFGKDMGKVNRVLQYRTGRYGTYVSDPAIIWSDWQDVPTVKE